MAGSTSYSDEWDKLTSALEGHREAWSSFETFKNDPYDRCSFGKISLGSVYGAAGEYTPAAGIPSSWTKAAFTAAEEARTSGVIQLLWNRITLLERLVHLERSARLGKESDVAASAPLEQLAAMSQQADEAIAKARVAIEDTSHFLAARGLSVPGMTGASAKEDDA